MKHKLKYLLIVSCATVVLSACDFNINDKPGPQMSFSVSEAKWHKTFLTEYTASDSMLNGFKINSVFIEKKFRRNNGLLL